MHVLTKFFVLAAAVLSVFLASLTIAYSVNAERITQSLAGAEARRAEAEANLATATSQARQEMIRINAEVEAKQRQLEELTAQISQLQGENTRLLAEKNRAEAERQGISGKIAELGELAKTQQALISSYREEVTTLRKNELTHRSEALNLEAKISDLESQREVLESTVRALQEQIAEARRAQETILAGRTGSPTSTGAAQPFVSTGPLIKGRVEEVRQDPSTGALLAKISIGSNAQVRENMKLFIVRDDQTFLANLIVVQTDLQWAIGRIDTLGQQVEVRPGDSVWSAVR